jgi:hypothetical protein
VKVDHLDGTAGLYGPAPQALLDEAQGDRLFTAVLSEATPLAVEERMQREIRFDPDLWLIEVDEPEGRHFLDLASDG